MQSRSRAAIPPTAGGRRAAFTLIELLIVIGIIAVLAGLILPLYNRVEESGRATKCLSNMRQVGAGCLAYTQDHDGILPGPCYGGQNAYCRYYYDASGAAHDPGGSLGATIAPYLGINVNTVSTYQPVLMCPSFAARSSKGKAGVNWDLNTYVRARSGLVQQPFGYPGTAAPLRLSNLDFNLTTTWAITELDRQWYTDTGAGWYNDLPPGNAPLHVSFRNAIFFDFHAGRLTGAKNTMM